jgi:predicted homoserine dehydrogenase-like protein
VGWPDAQANAASLDAALHEGSTHVGDDWMALIRHPAIDIVVDCTGSPVAAVDHCLEAFAQRKHMVNVTVEADALCGPMLAKKAAEAGVVYSLAFGDQPALICDLVDWARTCGFPVVAAGRGHKWLPHFCESTPDTVWGHYGLTPEQAARGGLNPKMFNSFLDGSKPSIESTAVANATGLGVPSNGLLYPPASIEDIPFVTRPKSEGGVLERKGMVEVISSLEADGRVIPYDIRMGVWVTVEAETEYIKNCFEEYNAHTDPSGRYFTLYKRWHLIGLEVGVSVASVALRGEATGVAGAWHADVVATAKRDLRAGEILDGEGGYTVWGKLLPAARSHAMGGLPLGLAHGVTLKRSIAKGQSLCFDDVSIDVTTRAYTLRREMERQFAAAAVPAAALPRRETAAVR